MPTYHSTGIHIALSISDISLSTTPDANTYKTAKVKENTDKADLALANGSLLNEQPVSINGRSSMGFLGAEKDMPFFLVHVNGEKLHRKSYGRHLHWRGYSMETGRKASSVVTSKLEGEKSSFNDSSTLQGFETTFAESHIEYLRFMYTKHENRNRRAVRKRQSSKSVIIKSQPTKSSYLFSSNIFNTVSPPAPNDLAKRVPLQNDHEDSPQALTLTVSIDPKSHVWYGAKQSGTFDIKIEVFFNGDFAACRLVTSKSRKTAKGYLTSYFSGKRIHRMAEHAWNVDFEDKGSDLKDKETFLKRWHTVGKMLRKDADLRGVDKFYQRSPTGQFLADLSELDMPEALKHVCAKSNRRMGIIDVVMSLGRGRKFTSNSHYLTQPKRLSDPDYSVEPNRINSENVTSNLRLSDPTIDPATAWIRAISLESKGNSEVASDSISIRSEKSNDVNEIFTVMIMQGSIHNPLDRSVHSQYLGRKKLTNQTETQANELSHPPMSQKVYPRKRPIQGKSCVEESSDSSTSLNISNSAGSDDSLHDEQCVEEETPSAKMPRSRKRLCGDLSVGSRRISGSPMRCLQSEKSKTLPRKLQHKPGSEVRTVSAANSVEANLNDLLRRSLRSGVLKNYNEVQSSSSTTSGSRTGAIDLQSHFINNVASDESVCEQHEALSGLSDMSNGAVASYAKAGPESDAGHLRSIKQEKNGEFKEDSLLMGVRFVLI